MAKRGARAVVTKRQLSKVEGAADVIAEIEKRMNRAEAEALKDVFIDGAKVIWSTAKRNIAALPIGPRAKRMLDAEVSIMRGKPKQAKVVVGMSQQAGKKKLGDGNAWNPYWQEFGTAERATKAGRRTGAIRSTPYFRPAVASSKTGVRDALAAGMKRLLVDAE